MRVRLNSLDRVEVVYKGKNVIVLKIYVEFIDNETGKIFIEEIEKAIDLSKDIYELMRNIEKYYLKEVKTHA